MRKPKEFKFMYQLSFSYSFESAHRFTRCESIPCMTPHGHSWRAVLWIQSLHGSLNENDMVTEFQSLKKQWKKFIQQTVDHSFFHHENDPLLPYLNQEIPKFRGLSFPGDPTTEMIATCFLLKAFAMHPKEIQAKPFKIEVFETQTNFVSYTAESPSEIFKNHPKLKSEKQWWNQAEPYSRERFLNSSK